jgi:hypothetical protein
VALTRDRDGETPAVAHDILAYLIEHPDAQDTVQGIVKWWLLEQTIRYQTTRVKRALAYLVEKGLVIERRSLNLRSRYQVNAGKLDEISALLRRTRLERKRDEAPDHGNT